MSAVATEVIKDTDGRIPVFRSYKEASDYIRIQYGKWGRVYPYKLTRLTKRHYLVETAQESRG